MGGQIISSRTTNAFHIWTTHHDLFFFIFIISDLQSTGDTKSAHERLRDRIKLHTFLEILALLVKLNFRIQNCSIGSFLKNKNLKKKNLLLSTFSVNLLLLPQCPGHLRFGSFIFSLNQVHVGRTISHRTIWHPDNMAPGQFGTGQIGTQTIWHPDNLALGQFGTKS